MSVWRGLTRRGVADRGTEVMSASESAVTAEEDNVVVTKMNRKKQRTVKEMVGAAEKRKRPMTSPKDSGTVSMCQSGMMEELKGIIVSSIEEANGKLWERIEAKLSLYERKIEKLESELYSRDQLVDDLQKKVEFCLQHAQDMEDQVGDLERNSRSKNLIIHSGRFGRRIPGEDIEAMTIQLLNECFPKKELSKKDFAAIHRLQNENSVICVFMNKNVRDSIYEGRVTLRQRLAEFGQRVYISESLTSKKREIFAELLLMKKKGYIWTAFTSNGIPSYKRTKESPPRRVYSQQQLQDLQKSTMDYLPTSTRDRRRIGGVGPVMAAGSGRDGGEEARPRPGGRPSAGPPPAAAGTDSASSGMSTRDAQAAVQNVRTEGGQAKSSAEVPAASVAGTSTACPAGEPSASSAAVPVASSTRTSAAAPVGVSDAPPAGAPAPPSDGAPPAVFTGAPAVMPDVTPAVTAAAAGP